MLVEFTQTHTNPLESHQHEQGNLKAFIAKPAVNIMTMLPRMTKAIPISKRFLTDFD